MPATSFILCIDSFDNTDGRVWSVKVGTKWLLAKQVLVAVPVNTVFLGVKHKQPKAYLRGTGVVHRVDEDTIVITER